MARAVLTWIVNGDALAQSVLCVALLFLLRDALAIRYRRGREGVAVSFPDVSIFKPLHGDEPEADRLLASWCELDYPASYEVLFVAETAAEPLYQAAERVALRYPAIARCLLSGAAGESQLNGKCHNLSTAEAEARFDLFLVSDSDTNTDPAALRRLVAPLADPRVAAVAATPRVTAAPGTAARLERLLVNTVLAPFEYAGAQLRGAHGLWGTLLLVRRDALAQAGGFRSLGRYLTEDIALEDALGLQGLRGALLRRPVNVVCAAHSIGQLGRHWHRWLVGLRRMRPKTHACLALILLAWLLPVAACVSMLLSPSALPERAIAVGGFAAVVICSLQALAVADIGVHEPATSYLLLPAAVAVLLFAYLRSFVDGRVSWRGSTLRIDSAGRIVGRTPADHDATAARRLR